MIRRELLVEGVTKHWHQPKLIDGKRLKHIEARQLMTHVGRIKAAPKERDAHTLMVRLRFAEINSCNGLTAGLSCEVRLRVPVA